MNDARETRWARILRTRSGGVLRAAAHAWALLPLMAVAAPEGGAPQPTEAEAPAVVAPAKAPSSPDGQSSTVSANPGKAGAPSVPTATAEQRSGRDWLDLGLGLNIGILTGLELRVLGSTDPGLMVGVSLRAGTLILMSDVGAQAMVGWERRQGNDLTRTYATFGVARYIVVPLFGSRASGTEFKVGLGLEGKSSSSFGLGLSGGLWLVCEDGRIPFLSGWGAVDVTFYFL